MRKVLFCTLILALLATGAQARTNAIYGVVELMELRLIDTSHGPVYVLPGTLGEYIGTNSPGTFRVRWCSGFSAGVIGVFDGEDALLVDENVPVTVLALDRTATRGARAPFNPCKRA